MSVLDSVDNMLASDADNGSMRRVLFDFKTVTTVATTTSGFVSAGRFPRNFTIPTVGAGLTGMVFPYFKMSSNQNLSMLVGGLEYLLGTITANGGTGTFVAGSSMPTKTVSGTSLQTSSGLLFAVISTVMVGAGTYTLNLTYTNQGGTGGQTITAMNIPNVAAVASAFFINPYLANGDRGIQTLTAATLTGTSGVIKIYGLLPLAFASSENSTHPLSMPNVMMIPANIYTCTAGETLGFYEVGTTGVSDLVVALNGIGENV